MPSTRDVPFSDSFHSLLTCFLRQRVRYCLIGALAVAAWGTSRATQDIDCLVLLGKRELARLLAALNRRGFTVDAGWAEHNPLLREHWVRLRRGGIPVDLLRPRDLHDRQTVTRRRVKVLQRQRIWVARPEDLIIMKLKAGRHRDFDDILSLIVEQGSRLDQRYLRRWAKRLGVWQELMYCLTQSKPPAQGR